MVSTQCPCGKTHERESPDGKSPGREENPNAAFYRGGWINVAPQVQVGAGADFRRMAYAAELGHQDHLHTLYAVDAVMRRTDTLPSLRESVGIRERSPRWRSPLDEVYHLGHLGRGHGAQHVAQVWEERARIRGVPAPSLDRFGPFTARAGTRIRLFRADSPITLHAGNVPDGTIFSALTAVEPRTGGDMASVLVWSEQRGREFWVEFQNRQDDRGRFGVTRWSLPGPARAGWLSPVRPPEWLTVERGSEL